MSTHTLSDSQNLSTNLTESKSDFHIHSSSISFNYGVQSMSIYKMQLDTAVREKQQPQFAALSPDTLEQHETPDRLQWLSHHMAKEKSSWYP